MRNSGQAFFAVLLLALFFLHGCTSSISQLVNAEHPAYEEKNMMDNLDTCVTANCSCMFCENNSVSKWFGLSSDIATLKNGNCSFFKGCTYDIAKNMVLNRPNITMKTFMLGTGSGFYDFTHANAYCRNGQDMAVKWLWSKEGDKYPLPEAERAGCFLDNGVIPVYILYSDGRAVSSQAGKVSVRDIAARLKGIGPVIVTTEMNSNKTNAMDVYQQAQVLKTDCPNCLVAVAPKMGDTEALDAVMQYGGGPYIDMVAIGVDSRYYGRQDCDPAWLLYLARNFSQYAMAKYQKPSVWAYMKIDEGENNSLNTCAWAPNSTAIMNSYFFLTEMPNALRDGTIGVAKYSYSGLVNPLNCSNCSDTVQAQIQGAPSAGIQLTPNEPAFSHWYAFCSVYASPDDKTNRLLIVYPNQSALSSNCPFWLENMRFYSKFPDNSPYMTNTQPGNIQPIPSDEMNKLPKSVVPGQPARLPALYYTCDFCIKGTGSAGSAATSVACDSFPELDIYADQYDLDPWFFRAIIQGESNFNPCAASIVAKDETTEKKYAGQYTVFPGDYGCYGKSRNYGVGSNGDPDGICNLPELPADLAYCGFGLTQVIEHPYTDWNGDYTGGDYSAQKVKNICFENFNPLNSTQAACLGAYKLKEKWDIAQGYIDGRSSSDYLGGEVRADPEVRKRYIAIVAAELYRGGFYGAWLALYSQIMNSDKKVCMVVKCENKDVTSPTGETITVRTCDNTEHAVTGFADYLVSCQNRDYGTKVLKRYDSLVSSCGRSDCPYGSLLTKNYPRP